MKTSTWGTGQAIYNDVLTDTGLNWRVLKTAGIQGDTTSGTAYTKDKCALVRSDTNTILGIAGPNYKIVQNDELAYMAHRITGGDLKLDTGGALKGGSRVWLSVRAPSFNVGGFNVDDEVKPYLLLSNGHDGLNSLHGLPTSIRTWCENTLNSAMFAGKKAGDLISIRHKGDMEEKIDQLVETLSQFNQQTIKFAEAANDLASKEMDSQKTIRYWRSLYEHCVDVVPTSVTSHKEQRLANKFGSTIVKWWDRLDRENVDLGNNMWTAFNAATHWVDHETTYRGDNKSENRFMSNFYGSAANRKKKMLDHTLNYA